jgi:HAD superfamily hydrolase (TIGR01484 family)
MKPLAELDATPILGVLTDIDDTLTTDGLLTAEAYAALCALKAAGFAVIPVTGRSAGWAHMIVKTWPVDAVVAESGGLYLHREPGTGRLASRYHAPAEDVARERARLAACAARVLRAIPGLREASDNAYRQVDLALDYCEEVPRVPEGEVARAIAMFRAEGFAARASSVHVNAWHGTFDKAPMALACLAERFAGSPLADPERWAFIGDAPNDASMFAAFRHSVAVSNILGTLDRFPERPAYLTAERSGAGFVAFARHLLRAQRAG